MSRAILPGLTEPLRARLQETLSGQQTGVPAWVTEFESGAVAHTGEDVPSAQLVALLDSVPSLRGPVAALTAGDDSPPSVAAAVEFVLEGLHLSKRLNKDASTGSSAATYRSRS